MQIYSIILCVLGPIAEQAEVSYWKLDLEVHGCFWGKGNLEGDVLEN